MKGITGIILAGGRGNRLGALTRYIPKPLLPVAGKPCLDFLIEQMITVPEIKEIIILIKKAYENNFRYWLHQIHTPLQVPIRLIIEDESQEGKVSGPIAGLHRLLTTEKPEYEDLFIVAGDNLISFQLEAMISFYKKYGKPIIAVSDFKNKGKIKGLYGVVTLDNNKIATFKEKPGREPGSTLVATCCYLFPANVGLPALIKEFMGKVKAVQPSMGHFIQWLLHGKGPESKKAIEIYGFVFNEIWFDIGTIETYTAANDFYKNKIKI